MPNNNNLTMSLEESLKLTTPELQPGVVETYGSDQRLLSLLPMKKIEGNTYTYNVETDLSDVQFRKVGEEIKPGQTKFTQKTAALKILGEEAVIDTFQIGTQENVNDLMAIEVSLKAKALLEKYQKTLIFGDSNKDVNAFDGLEKLVVDSQKITATANIAKDIDHLLDLTLHPNALIMSKSTRRMLVAQNREYITFTRDFFGGSLTHYGDILILDVPDDFGINFADIFAVNFDESNGVCGLYGGEGVRIQSLGEIANAPQYKTRIEFFCGLALLNPKAVAFRTMQR